MATAAPSPVRILPTLNPDGTRNRIRPKLAKGKFLRARFWLAWALMAFFVACPFIHVNQKPLILLDIPEREFTFFGQTLLATDGVLVMITMLGIFVGIFLLSAVLGRAWCGWGCPQTVYMEFLFRPIERLFEGNRSEQLKLDREGPNLRRVLKNIVFGVISVFLANVFVGYFIGVDVLFRWMLESPFSHPVAFAVMAGTAALVFVDFAYFREQMCTVACPYARLQAVLLDRRSLVIGYDARRGEPRTKKPKDIGGDCIDCLNCVVTCPTGIDIRNGLQLDCIACAQCADACDRVMDKIKRPRGLIRYGSVESLETGKPTRVLRPRVAIYAALLGIALGALVLFRTRQGTADVTVLRGLGEPYVVDAGTVRNHIRVKIENRSGADRDYTIELKGVAGGRLIAPENPLHVRQGTHESCAVFVIAPQSLFANGPLPIQIRVFDGAQFDREVPYRLIGPRAPGAP